MNGFILRVYDKCIKLAYQCDKGVETGLSE